METENRVAPFALTPGQPSVPAKVSRATWLGLFRHQLLISRGEPVTAKPSLVRLILVRPLDAMLFFITVVCLAALAFLVGTLIERKRMRQFWQRACTGRLWRRRFPHSSKSEIREFLDVFIEAFGFADRRRLCFAPDDRVMDVYRALYPVRGSADSMELEDLVTGLRERYRVEILGSWREDITLGDLFTQTRPRVA